MDKEELGKKITELIRDEDKERTIKLINDINTKISEFRTNYLKFNTPIYDEVSISSSRFEAIFRIKNISLNYKFNENKIAVLRSVDDKTEMIDEIYFENGKAYCKNGEFNLEKIDEHILNSFSKLFY